MTQTDANPFVVQHQALSKFHDTESKNNFNSSNRAKMEAEIEEEAPQASNVRSRYIKKRALKNKALAVSFDEKDLKDYVTGFHKRKKKRRKEAEKNQEEALRRKRVECRAKRKLERASVYGGGVDSAPDENEEYCDEDEEIEPVASVAGTTLYDNGDTKVTVTTSEISHEEENFPNETTPANVPRSITAGDKKHNIPVVSKNKSIKKVVRRRSHPKPLSKRDKRKGKKTEQRRR